MKTFDVVCLLVSLPIVAIGIAVAWAGIEGFLKGDAPKKEELKK